MAITGCYAGTDPEERGDGGGTVNSVVNGEVVLLESTFAGAGSGSRISVTFTPRDEVEEPVYEQNPGSPFACKVYERTVQQALYPGVDEGTIQLSMSGGPDYPPCTYVPDEGYRCISVSGSGGDIQSVADAEYRINNPAVSFGSDEVGRHVEISGASIPENNGTLAIESADDATITYINDQPGATAETGTTASYRVLAGLGPSGQTDPLGNADPLTIELTAGGEGDLESFSYTLQDIGDAFTLDTASQAVLSSIPMDGSEFTLSCGGDGGSCGTAVGSGIQLFTTDGPIDTATGMPPFVLPPPVSKSIFVSCVFLSPDATVPAAASAYVQSSGATRILTNYVRVNTASVPQASGSIQILSGHSILGITDL